MEVWRAIPGFEGRYEASDHGRVRSLPRMVQKSGRGIAYQRDGKILKPTSGTRQRQMVTLWRDGKSVTRAVHILVMLAFVGPCPPGLEVCHWDDDSANNLLTNLRYGTHSENMHDRNRNGGNPQLHKQVCSRGHRLAEPNLRKVGLKAGKRQCLSCAQARTTVWRSGGEMQELADANFRRLMSA